MKNTGNKKKILYVITKSNWGGAQRYVYDLATSLPSDAFDVCVVHGGKGLLGEKLRDAGIRTISIPYLERNVKIGNELRTFVALVRLFREEKPDIIHLNSSKIGGIGSLAGRIARVPRIIFTAHGWYVKENRPKFVRISVRFLSWLTALFSHTIIVVSDDDKRSAPRFIVSKKVVRIHNGLSVHTILKRNTARKKIREIVNNTTLQRGAHWVGTISELHKNKGLVYAIDAISHARKSGTDVLFFIIGDGEDRAALQNSIARHNMEDSIFLLGHVSDASKLLSAFDIFTLTSTKEGFPYALLEAGIAECAVVASSVGGIPEIIADMETGILTYPNNSEEVAKAILFLVQNKTKRKELGAALQTHVTKNFTKDRMLRATLSLY